MMAEIYCASTWKGSLSKTEEDFTRIHPAKPPKGDQKETPSEAGIPMLRKSKACPHIK